MTDDELKNLRDYALHYLLRTHAEGSLGRPRFVAERNRRYRLQVARETAQAARRANLALVIAFLALVVSVAGLFFKPPLEAASKPVAPHVGSQPRAP